MKLSTKDVFIPHSSSLIPIGLWLVFVAAIVLLAGCGKDESSVDDLTPSTPRWVPRSQDNVYPQQGIRAEASGEGDYAVHVEWFANPEPDIVGYRIYRFNEFANESNHYVVRDLRIGVQLDPGLDRYSWVDHGDTTDGTPLNMLSPDPYTGDTRGYYWEVSAYDSAGNNSRVSSPAYYRLLSNPFALQVFKDSTNVYQASWHYSSNPDVLISYYMVRVYEQGGGPDSVVWFGTTQQYGSDAAYYMDFSQVPRPLIFNDTYVFQLNVISTRFTPDHVDSTSGAAVFTTFVYQN